ncbi:hypothetical protein LXL04_012986 [Taraxacum kok-saghyz]
MEKHALPVAVTGENAKEITRSQWKRSLVELTGKLESSYRHDVSPLLMESYSEIGVFPHAYYIDGSRCKTHNRHLHPLLVTNGNEFFSFDFDGATEVGVSGLEFDKQGMYLASGTKAGCLTIHNFESLYCQSNQPLINKILEPDQKEDERKQLLHILLPNSIDNVRWNPANQNEVACTSYNHSEVHIFNIRYMSSEPTQVLRKRPTSADFDDTDLGLTDIILSNDSRVFASDKHGVISIWDRRAGDLPQSGLTTNSNARLTSIQVTGDHYVLGASQSGIIHMWDIRDGTSSAALQSHTEVHSSPWISLELASMQENELLKALSKKKIDSIGINPSYPHQLGFHLDNGWSGVFDMHDFLVTHIHRTPVPWLEEDDYYVHICYKRKPSWLPDHSIYVVGSASSNALHLLDFNPSTNSPCHVDHDELKERHEPRKQNMLIPLSGHVTACATHPLNGTIVVGTLREAALLVISQQQLTWQIEEVDANDDN